MKLNTDIVKVDDAVGATCVHGFGGAWGMLAVGLFAKEDKISDGYSKYDGFVWSKCGFPSSKHAILSGTCL